VRAGSLLLGGGKEGRSEGTEKEGSEFPPKAKVSRTNTDFLTLRLRFTKYGAVGLVSVRPRSRYTVS